MQPPRTLPIRFAPLPGEPLDSWLEAYAHRLHATTIGDLLADLGLAGPPGQQATDHTVYLHDADAARLAQATGRPVPRLHDMTLRIYDGHVIQLARSPQRRAVVRSAWWGRGSGSRYCPDCLTDRGGRWLLRWRLSWVFACTRHAALLHDTCLACGYVPRASVMTIRHDHAPGTCPRHTCRADLRRARRIPLRADSQLVATQAWIDTILAAVETGTTDHLRVAPDVVFTDLRTVAGWLLRQGQPGDFDTFAARDVPPGTLRNPTTSSAQYARANSRPPTPG